MENKNEFTFGISLSILNHLGRSLYRSFVTVLGEAISNAWDANAENVNIYVDRENNSFIIKDDGIGMSRDDFQDKFLKIGYTKRKSGETKSPVKERPYIGRKGIGKLALLSCAGKISVMSKTTDGDYVGGTIDNTGLDEAIKNDLTPDQYKLGEVDPRLFGTYINDHKQGTLIYFDTIKEGINRSSDYLKKIIALYFRFSLLDDSFNIFIDDEKITFEQLEDLAKETQFLWNINNLNDPYINEYLKNLKEPVKNIVMEGNVEGFIASVTKPRCLKITSTDERAGVDLFVNGRLRERDILKRIPTARIAENYFYGQIHFNELDDENDRFATGREGIIADDPKYKEFLDNLRRKILDILEDWDAWRRKLRQDGDPENESISRKERASQGLYNAVSEEYDLPKGSENRQKVDGWVGGLSDDAVFNFESYAECFISENLARKFIQEKRILPSTEQLEINKWRGRERREKRIGNLNIEIRQSNDDLFYLSMGYLVKIAEPPRDGYPDTLLTDEKQFTPIRNAVMHTSLLTPEAKRRLTTVYDNIKARIINLLS
ncbi:MAG: ATP-binding protein [Candidatus Omnitrophica bacterium]|nr:ATP-binding protein [Candidatus Omnitrophota bacterium]